jgi:hypothetical protein
MGKVHNILEIWQGSQILGAAQNESHAQNKQLTAVGYNFDTEMFITASWSNFKMQVLLDLDGTKDRMCHNGCLQRPPNRTNSNMK